MADLKEPAHGNLWPNYGAPVHQLPARFNSSLDPGLSSHSTTPTHPARPRNGLPPADSTGYPYNRYAHDESDTYDRPHHANLSSQHGYHESLKRPYSHVEQPPYQEIVQDLRHDGSKMTVNHDHKLLSFKKVPDKHTIVDQHGRIQQLELSAQLHGMFFLSEMPSSTSDGTVLQPELTCYRRNLFQISGSLITSRSPLSVITEAGETVPVSSTEVTVSAMESVDGHPVRLIVIPWKTPPPNSSEVTQGPDQEPPSLPLIPFQEDGTETEGEYAVYPIGWRRLQFRIATANNGRRKELQQHFVLHLKVVGTLTNGSKAVLAEAITAPIVVRGRSPRNFQARKEIPLLGSSAGSRGQALVETGVGVVAGPLTVKPHEAKARGLDIQVPRGAFTFTSGGPRMPSTQLGPVRQSSYSNWAPATIMPLPQNTTPATANYPPTTMPGEHYPKAPISSAPVFGADSQDIPLSAGGAPVQVPMASNEAPRQPQPVARTSYSYAQSTTGPPPLSLSTTTDAAASIPRYVDTNPRPTKSPRHGSHPSINSTSSMGNNDGSSEYRYSSSYPPVNQNTSEMPVPNYGTDAPSGTNPTPPREYYAPATGWTTSAGEPTSTMAYANESRSYTSPGQYKSSTAVAPAKSEPLGATTGPSAVYNGPQRGSFDAMNHYSWHAV
ncbi:NDT80/PhoG like DNA-binding family protein [Sodiomyces alkalinus F11]|uniref:NDT80/PhoG like DNA-binding family protein n=1 Tax=Sodiomyces alkalinus (strain CBS 110278 / VKM F-3762 / F11) TaxID=1314773 RepID=A0A3N2Q8T1_SODAK|nr:NDT80/PhoG like DNA-binding family protein [Sodiomyces alkalinus F11]ROT43189.1 NDT80/PhoG like DNA-binding family protein [Sodiomyces alkalinus F11]